jgi:hypothetical protein
MVARWSTARIAAKLIFLLIGARQGGRRTQMDQGLAAMVPGASNETVTKRAGLRFPGPEAAHDKLLRGDPARGMLGAQAGACKETARFE